MSTIRAKIEDLSLVEKFMGHRNLTNMEQGIISWNEVMPVVERIQRLHRKECSLKETEIDEYGLAVYVGLFGHRANWKFFYWSKTERLTSEDDFRVVSKSKLDATWDAVLMIIKALSDGK